ncbi:MAG: MBL fold metallo-hydrolase [Actinobacteria bacterium]|nr:MBL fold metallo-hydrolase [Actinomycetota bacterium]
MTYTGNVTVGGPAAVHELRDLVISKLAVGPYDNNAYLLRCTRTGRQVLLDAAADGDRLLELVGEDGLDAVVTTHGHRDHWQATAEVLEATGAEHLAHADDAGDIEVPVTRTLSEGDEVAVGDARLRVVHLRGHTPGSVALVYDDPTGAPHVFTGDSLFPGGVGNTWGDADRFASLYADVTTKLFDALPDETWVYPGHGKDTTLGAERPHLQEWLDRGW